MGVVHKNKDKDSLSLPDGVISLGWMPIFIVVLVHSTVEVSVMGRIIVCH